MITIVHGVFKPTNITRGHHPVAEFHMINRIYNSFITLQPMDLKKQLRTGGGARCTPCYSKNGLFFFLFFSPFSPLVDHILVFMWKSTAQDSCLGGISHMSLSENSVPLNPRVNHHVSIFSLLNGLYLFFHIIPIIPYCSQIISLYLALPYYSHIIPFL